MNFSKGIPLLIASLIYCLCAQHGYAQECNGKTEPGDIKCEKSVDVHYKGVLAPNSGTMSKPARRFRLKQGTDGSRHLVASNDPAQNMQMFKQFAEAQASGAFAEDFVELWVLKVDMNRAQLTEFVNGDDCKVPATTTAKTTASTPKATWTKPKKDKTTTAAATSASATETTETEMIAADIIAMGTSTSTEEPTTTSSSSTATIRTIHTTSTASSSMLSTSRGTTKSETTTTNTEPPIQPTTTSSSSTATTHTSTTVPTTIATTTSATNTRTSTDTTRGTIRSTNTTNATTTTKPPICDAATFVRVHPAPIVIPARNVTEYAVRVGFHEFETGRKFDEGRVREVIEGLIENASALIFAEKSNGTQWRNDAMWVANIKIGRFQYALVESAKPIVMLMYNCSFGKFLMHPFNASRDNGIKPDQNGTLDWTKDFEHVEKCKGDLEEISSDVPEDKRTTWVTRKSVGEELEFKVNFTVGQIATDTNKTSLVSAAGCEALKYKYGYTFPLRHPELDESKSNYTKAKGLGALLLDANETCAEGGMQHFELTAKFKKFDRRALLDQECEDGGNKTGDCSSGLKHAVHLYQSVYNCDGLQYRMPRVVGHASYIYENKSTEYAERWVQRYKIHSNRYADWCIQNFDDSEPYLYKFMEPC